MNKGSHKSILFAVLALSCLVFGSLFTSGSVYAIGPADINKIVLQNQAQTCYNSSSMNAKISNGFSISAAFKKKGSIVLMADNGSGGTYNCRVVFETLNSLTRKNPGATDLGYTRSSNDSGSGGPVSRCVVMSYVVRGVTYYTEKWCMAVRDGDIDMGETPEMVEQSTNPGGVFLGLTGNNSMAITLYGMMDASPWTVDYYNRTWDEFETNLRKMAANLNGTHIQYNNIDGDIQSANIVTSVGSDDRYVTYEIKNNDFNAAKQTMMRYYFGNSTAPKLTGDYWSYVLDSSYRLALSTGHITQRACVDTKDEALKQTTYAFYDSASNKWCPVDIESRDKNGESTGGNKYPLVKEGNEALGLYSIEEVLKLQTGRNLGNQTAADVCTTNANNRLQELRAARTAEYEANGNSSRYQYLLNAAIQLSGMIRDNKLVNSNGTCADIPTVNQDAQTQKNACNSVFNTAIAQLRNIINGSNSTANEKADAQDKLDKINALNGVYWTEDSGGDIVCKKLEDVYNGTSGGTTGGENGGNTNGGSTTDSDDPGLLDGCMSNAGVLGWILCPVIRLIGGAIEGVYSGIEGLLMVDANTVTDPATRSAWSQFQGYANIVFAIVLAIVIISQVTGIGLNNYNIKKILPRLIITIVLVNLSFIICSIAIDLSNILGVRLKDLFDGLHVVNQGIFDVDPGAFVRNTLESLLEVGPIVLGAGVAISVIMTAELWKMMILPLLLGFIVMLISILFFFIILGVRQAAIIILLVVSPIAIICYTLPNTQKVFDRWLKMFSSLLIVYPICGLMMGGGQFMSRLLLNAGGSGMSFMYYLTAMLLSVVPFFFIPTILKGSLTAMGNLGLKLSQMGSRVSSGVARSIRGSDWAREYQRDQALSQSRGAYERLNRREQAIKDAGGRGLNARDARRRSRYARQMLRLEAEDRRAGYNPAQVEAARRHQLIQQQNDDISGRQDLYRGGSMSSIIAGHTDPINGNNNDELADELDAYMDRIVTGQTADGRTLTQDEINDDVMNAQALINTLADQGTSGARAKVEQSFARAMHRHQSIFGDPDQGGRLSHTFGSLAARTNAKYGKDFKKDSPGAAAMLGDIAQGSFTRAGTFSDSGRVETRHADTDHERKMSILRSSYYGGSGAGVSGMSTEDFSKLKAYGANNILDGLRAGQITGSNARAAARMADEVLNSGVYTPDSDVRDILEQIRTAGYSAGGDLNGRSTGSLALSGASTSALESVVSDVSGIADSAAWESLSDAERKNYRQLFNNIRETLDNDTLSAANADQLQQALKIAHDRGFTDASGNVIGAFSGTPHLKIDHSATQPIVVPPVPQGWTEGGMWTGGGSGPSKQQEIAYQEWAKIKARADMQNNGGNP